MDVDSYGVWGILGNPDDVADIVDRITNLGSFGPLQRTGILGRNALPDQGTAIYSESHAAETTAADAFGFIAGRSPFAGEVTGVFGQAPERGVIGIAGANGIGVYGGTIDGAGTGVFGDAGDNQSGVIGRSSGPKGVGVQGVNTGGGLADSFSGNVDLNGNLSLGVVNGPKVSLTINGQDLLTLIQQLAAQLTYTTFGIPSARPPRPQITLTHLLRSLDKDSALARR
jgi:hypothetical protein